MVQKWKVDRGEDAQLRNLVMDNLKFMFQAMAYFNADVKKH